MAVNSGLTAGVERGRAIYLPRHAPRPSSQLVATCSTKVSRGSAAGPVSRVLASHCGLLAPLSEVSVLLAMH